jgi:undecaprenyl-diphosphatase
MLGVLAAGWLWVRRVVLPARPDGAPTPHPERLAHGTAAPSADGSGVRIVVNPTAGPAWASAATDELRAALPGADAVELDDGADLDALLRDPAYRVIGAAGGDGTLSAAASIAVDRGVPLVAVPGGTLNHLARDLGLTSTDDAVAGVRHGGVACIDVGVAGERTFVNTLSFGGYRAVVDTRERWEGRIGKWPALVLALVVELPRMAPCRLELDGRPAEVWLGWIGNGAYDPPGLGPAWRERLDDGLLDVRLLHGGRLARTRFVASALLGRLGTLGVYSERRTSSLRIRSLDGPLRLVADGEVVDAPADLTVEKRRRALQVVLPEPAAGPGPTDEDLRLDPSGRA